MTVERVAVRAAVEAIVTDLSVERVVAAVAPDHIIPVIAVEHVWVCAAEESVVTTATEERIAAITSHQNVRSTCCVVGAGDNGIAAVRIRTARFITNQRVRSVESKDQVVTPPSHNSIWAESTLEVIIAPASFDGHLERCGGFLVSSQVGIAHVDIDEVCIVTADYRDPIQAELGKDSDLVPARALGVDQQQSSGIVIVVRVLYLDRATGRVGVDLQVARCQ